MGSIAFFFIDNFAQKRCYNSRFFIRKIFWRENENIGRFCKTLITKDLRVSAAKGENMLFYGRTTISSIVVRP